MYSFRTCEAIARTFEVDAPFAAARTEAALDATAGKSTAIMERMGVLWAGIERFKACVCFPTPQK